jgi:hypothetical protein
MSQHGDYLPEDLREIAARLSAARVTPNPLDLDELRQRVHGRARRVAAAPRRRRLASALRMNFVASALTSTLVLTSGAGVVLACTGGGSPPPPPGWSSSCQYNRWWTKTGTWSPGLTVTETWSNNKLKVTITNDPPKPQSKSFTYAFGPNGPSGSATGSITVTAPAGTTTLHVTADGKSYSFTFSY